jgi:hypothetical protein
MTKKLAWFSSHLLKKNVGYWNPIINRQIGPVPYDDRLRWHVAMQKLAPGVVCMTDHTGFSRNYGDGLDMAITVPRAPDVWKTIWDLERGKQFDEDFSGLINSRAAAAFAQADRINAECIFLSYGGGVDSCMMLAALLQNPAAAPWLAERRLILKTTRFAQVEDPIVWNRIVELDLPLEYLSYDDLQRDTRRWMMVTGDVEPVWGSAYVPLAKDWLTQTKRYSGNWQTLEKLFLNEEPSGLAWEYFRDLQATAPFEVKTCMQAWWWFEWCTNTQCYLYRFVAYSDCEQISADRVFPGSKLFWFLGHTDMWDHGAYVTAERLIPENLNFLKLHCLRYTADWMGWSDPKPKPKVFSQLIIPKRVSKMRIFDDLSWDSEEEIINE